MSKNLLIALIAICAAAAVAGAAIAAVSLNKNNDNGSNDNGSSNGGSDDSSTNSTNVTMTGISVLYDGNIIGNTGYVKYDDAQSVKDKIGVAAIYSDNTSKSVTDFTVTSTLSESYNAGDTFTITVTYSTYTASVIFTIVSADSLPFVITFEEGTTDCYNVDVNVSGEYTVTFSEIDADTKYSILGTLNGNIVIDVGEDYDFKLELNGLTMSSSNNVPIDIESADNVSISAIKNTINSITDKRSEVSDDGISACIYSLADLEIKGKGTLYVKSENNNGIHTKDDLEVKNLTLVVECEDNALKGNDSVTIESGTVTLIARTGDGIKTSNSDNNDKQRGTVTICSEEGDLELNIYAACDGIDAAYDVSISEKNGNTVELNIYTDQYSEYSEDVTSSSSNNGSIYLRTTSMYYKYSILFSDSSGNTEWVNPTIFTSERGMRMTYYYYTVTVPSGYTYMQVYTYSSSQDQGQSDSYQYVTSRFSVNTSFDVIAVSGSSYQWTSYNKDNNTPGGNVPGGQEEGNSDKGDYSTKGIKADNSITITSGTIFVKSYDDSIHANGGETLENNSTGTGNVSICGGTLTLFSKDDGIHGDGTVTISDGTVTVTNSYEGIEGNYVRISGGDVSVTSSDDGVNGTCTSGTSISISGGTLYIYAGGDGIDSNSTTNGTGIIFSGGDSVIISTSGGNSSIDSERGWKYSGGRVLAISPSGAMTQEISNYTTASGKVTVSSVRNTVSSGTYVTASSDDTIVAVKLPCSMNGLYVAYCGSSSVTISTSSGSFTTDSNGVYWA